MLEAGHRECRDHAAERHGHLADTERPPTRGSGIDAEQRPGSGNRNNRRPNPEGNERDDENHCRLCSCGSGKPHSGEQGAHQHRASGTEPIDRHPSGDQREARPEQPRCEHGAELGKAEIEALTELRPDRRQTEADEGDRGLGSARSEEDDAGLADSGALHLFIIRGGRALYGGQEMSRMDATTRGATHL